jgi:hypothetical protein
MQKPYAVPMLVAVTLAGCQALQVQPAGSLSHGVVFHLADLFHEQHAEPFVVVTIVVTEEYPSGSALQVWFASGPGESLRDIVYGGKYRSFNIVQPAMPLQRGKKYRIAVATTTGRQHYSAAYFQIDQNGVVIPLTQ